MASLWFCTECDTKLALTKLHPSFHNRTEYSGYHLSTQVPTNKHLTICSKSILKSGFVSLLASDWWGIRIRKQCFWAHYQRSGSVLWSSKFDHLRNEEPSIIKLPRSQTSKQWETMINSDATVCIKNKIIKSNWIKLNWLE